MARYFSHIKAKARTQSGGRAVELVLGGSPSGPTVFEGDEGNNIVTGTDGPDIIRTFGGSDLIQAQGGDDTIYPGPGNDTAYGGPGDDLIEYEGRGRVYLYGGDGNDTIDMDYGRGFCATGPGVNLVRIKMTANKEKEIRLEGTGDTLDVEVFLVNNPVEALVVSFDLAADTLIIEGSTINLRALPSRFFITTDGDDIVLHDSNGSATLRFQSLGVQFDGYGFDYGENYGQNGGI